MTPIKYDAIVDYYANTRVVNLKQAKTHFTEDSAPAPGGKKPAPSKSGRDYFKEIGGNGPIHIVGDCLGVLVFRMRELSRGIFNEFTLARMQSIPCYRDMIHRFKLNDYQLSGKGRVVLNSDEFGVEKISLFQANGRAIFFVARCRTIIDLDLVGWKASRLDAHWIYGNDKFYYFCQKLENDYQILKINRATGEFSTIQIHLTENCTLVNGNRQQTLNQLWSARTEFVQGSNECNFYFVFGFRKGMRGRLVDNLLYMEDSQNDIFYHKFIEHGNLHFKLDSLAESNVSSTLALRCFNKANNEQVWQQNLRKTTTDQDVNFSTADRTYVGALYRLGKRFAHPISNLDVFEHSGKETLQISNLTMFETICKIWINAGFLAYLQAEGQDKASLVVWDLKTRYIVSKKSIDDPASFVDVAILPQSYKMRITRQFITVVPRQEPQHDGGLSFAASGEEQRFLEIAEFELPKK